MSLRVRLLLVLLVLCPGVLAQGPTQQQIDQFAQGVGQLAWAQSIATHCKWTNPYDLILLGSMLNEQLQRARMIGGAVQTAVESNINAATKQGDTYVCTSSDAESKKAMVQNFVNVGTANYVARARVMLDVEDRNPQWGTNLTTLSPYRATILQMDTILAGQKDFPYDRIKTEQGSVAQGALPILCLDRKGLRAPKGRDCPAADPEAQRGMPYVKAMVEGTEGYITQMAQAMQARQAQAAQAKATAPTAAAATEHHPYPVYKASPGLADYGDAADYAYIVLHPYGETEHPTDCGSKMSVIHLKDPNLVYLTSANNSYLYAPVGPADGTGLKWKLIAYDKTQINAPAVLPMRVLDTPDDARLSADVKAWKAAETAHTTAKRDAVAASYDAAFEESAKNHPTYQQARRCGVRSAPDAETAYTAHGRAVFDHLSSYVGFAKDAPQGTGPLDCKATGAAVVKLDSPGSFFVTGKIYRMYFTEVNGGGMIGGYWQWFAEDKNAATTPGQSRKLLRMQMKDEDEALAFAELVRPRPGSSSAQFVEMLEMRPMQASINGSQPVTWRPCQ